jgi:hypothetical protein
MDSLSLIRLSFSRLQYFKAVRDNLSSLLVTLQFLLQSRLLHPVKLFHLLEVILSIDFFEQRTRKPEFLKIDTSIRCLLCSFDQFVIVSLWFG